MPASGRAALHEHAPGEEEREQPHRDVHEEHQPPARGRDQQAAERRADARGQRRDRRPQRDRVHALALLAGLEHDRQRAGHQRRRARRLDDAGGDQQVQRRRHRAQRGGEREQQQGSGEHPPAAEQVRELAAADEERREHDVVGVQHPRDARQRRAREVPRDVRHRDVDDRRVDERHERAQHRDREHGCAAWIPGVGISAPERAPDLPGAIVEGRGRSWHERREAHSAMHANPETRRPRHAARTWRCTSHRARARAARRRCAARWRAPSSARNR